MRNAIKFLLAALMAFILLGYSSLALAQPVDKPDDGDGSKPAPPKPPAPSGDAGVCSSADAACQSAYTQCIQQKSDGETANDALTKSLAFCNDPDKYCREHPEDKERCTTTAKKPVTKQQPVKWTCEGVPESKPEQDGNDCKCGEGYVAVVKTIWKTKVCASTQDTKAIYDRLHKLEVDLEAQKAALESLGKWAANENERMLEVMKEIKELYALLLTDPGGVMARINQIQIQIDGLNTRVSALEETVSRLGSLPRASSSLTFQGGYVGLPGAGAGGSVELCYRQTFWFTNDSPVALIADACAGRLFNDNVGPAWLFGGGAGLRVDLTKDRMHSLAFTVQGKQIISDHATDYQDVLHSQGMGFLVGGQAEYELDVARFLHLKVIGGLDYAHTNYFVGPGKLELGKGLGGYLGLGIGGHVDYGK